VIVAQVHVAKWIGSVADCVSPRLEIQDEKRRVASVAAIIFMGETARFRRFMYSPVVPRYTLVA
jgi:hypothetical protein